MHRANTDTGKLVETMPVCFSVLLDTRFYAGGAKPQILGQSKPPAHQSGFLIGVSAFLFSAQQHGINKICPFSDERWLDVRIHSMLPDETFERNARSVRQTVHNHIYLAGQIQGLCHSLAPPCFFDRGDRSRISAAGMITAQHAIQNLIRVRCRKEREPRGQNSSPPATTPVAFRLS